MKTQTISRKELAKIYEIVCEGWQKVISKLVLFQSGEEIEVENELILKAYNEADSTQKEMIKKHFKVESNKIQDRLKTWEDIVKYLGISQGFLTGLIELFCRFIGKRASKEELSTIAFWKIRKISEALNEGWKADFSKGNNQYKYYPYFIKDASGGWVVGSSYSCSDFATMGSGFYFKSSELALYAGNQFLDIYKDYLPD